MNRNALTGPFIHTLAICVLLVLAGCGGGSGGGGTPAVTVSDTLTTYYASGRIEATGHVLTGTAIKTGSWVIHHDVDSSPKKWHGWYRENAIDTAKPWTEWNADGSIRYAAGDR